MSERHEPIERAERADAIEMSYELREVIEKLRKWYVYSGKFSHKAYRDAGGELVELTDDLSALVVGLDSEINDRLREDYITEVASDRLDSLVEKTPEV